MKKKIIFLAILLIFPIVSYAKSAFYTNKNGISLTEEEYNYLTQRFSERFISIMSQDDYNNLIDESLMDKEVKKSFSVMPLASDYYETGSKRLTISSVCNSSYCSISVELKWLRDPTVRSYDVIGAYLLNTKLLTDPTTVLVSSTEDYGSENILKQTNGFGVSIKLPEKATDIYIYQYYNVSLGGSIYQSYQHAARSASLSDSKKYTISRSGYGKVFLFDNSVREKYDAMGGVYINL